MRNPYEIYLVQEHDLGEISGYSVLVSEWSDRAFTVFASRMERGSEDVIMDADKQWYDMPSEDEIAREIEEILEERFDAAHA